jgi:hypothetical protein
MLVVNHTYMLLRSFHWAECVSDAETALHKDRHCHAALAIKAKAHLKLRHYRAAIRDFEMLLELYPWAPVITELNQVMTPILVHQNDCKALVVYCVVCVFRMCYKQCLTFFRSKQLRHRFVSQRSRVCSTCN